MSCGDRDIAPSKMMKLEEIAEEVGWGGGREVEGGVGGKGEANVDAMRWHVRISSCLPQLNAIKYGVPQG